MSPQSQLDESVGKRESWPKTTTQKFADIADFCCDRLLVVSKAQKATKRGKIEAQAHRRAAVDAGAYDVLSLTLQKYENFWGLQMKCIQVRRAASNGAMRRDPHTTSAPLTLAHTLGAASRLTRLVSRAAAQHVCDPRGGVRQKEGEEAR